MSLLLDVDEWVKKTVIQGDYLPKITSPSLRLQNGSYDENGLFSTKYFGQQGSPKWNDLFSYIELPLPIIHPALYYIIERRVSFLLKWINLSIGGQWENQQLFITDETSKYNICGLSDLYDNNDLVCNTLLRTGKIETLSAKTLINKLLKKEKATWISHIIVPPPLFRPNDDDNAIFVKIISEIQILRSAISSNDKLLKNRLLYSIQSLNHQLFNSMIDKIKGKTGLVRGNMLGRNADFSARGVIVGDPTIDADHLGVPKSMLVRLFYPWIINYILTHREVAVELSKYTAVNKPALHSLINEKLFNDEIDPALLDILYKVTEEVVKDKVVIAKRDPTLHKLSVRAFYPIPVDGSAIKICPAVCPGLNADFDGDQMAIFVPLTEKSQKQAKEKMLASNNPFAPKGGLALALEKEWPTLIFYITLKDLGGTVSKFNDDVDILKLVEKIEKADDYYKRIEYRGKINTLGRRMMEIIFEDRITIDKTVSDKVFNDLIMKIAPDGKWLVRTLHKIQVFCMAISSTLGGDIGMNTFILHSDLAKRRDEVLDHPDKYDVSKELSGIANEFSKRLIDTGQYIALAKESGGTKCDFQQISVAKGYVSDVTGATDPVPIRGNFSTGLSSTDYFRSAAGNRKGVCDRVINVAKSGYLTRQMIYLMSTVKSGNKKFCGTKRLFETILTDDLLPVLEGRILQDGNVLTKEYATKNNLIDKPIKYYTPMYCQSRELCECCYPPFYRKLINNVPNVGIISAQCIGERASQLIMKQFHTGGASKIIYLATECPETKNYINQDGNNLYATVDLKLRIIKPDKDSVNVFPSRNFTIFDKNGDEISIEFLAIIEFDGLAAKSVVEDGQDIIMEFEKTVQIGNIISTAADTTSATMILQGIMDHGDRFEEPEEIVHELYQTFKVATKMPYLYFEMLVSQLMRDPKKLSNPYRLSPMNEAPKLVPIKRVAMLENIRLGIQFERINDVLTNSILGVQDDDDNRQKSDLEDLFKL